MNNYSEKEFLGQGFAFPFQFTPSGQMRLVPGQDDIHQAIQIILSTVPGERLMRPEFGCRVYDLVFESRDANTANLLKLYVREALNRWEPRIRVTDIRVNYTREHNKIYSEIDYIVKSTHDERSIVYPFYLMGKE